MLAKTIRSLLNGGGTAAGVKGLRKAIAEIEAELGNYRRELDQIPAQRVEAALVDDAEKTIETLRAREIQLSNMIEVSEVRLGRLRERLHELTHDDRQKDFTERRTKIIEASDRVAAAIRMVHEAAVNLVAQREAATSAGFAFEVQQIPLMPFILNIVDPMPLLDPFERAMTHYRQTSPALRVHTPPQTSPSPPQFGKTQYGGADPKFTGGTPPRPAELVQGHVATSSTNLPKVSRPAPRALFNDQPGEGERQVLVLRSGYEDPKGRQCRNGDIIALPIAMATKAVQAGAAEYHGDNP